VNPPPPRALVLARDWLTATVSAGDLAVDATAGNGHDTLLLARLVGPAGRVLAIDLQDSAIAATRSACTAAGLLDRVALVRADHAGLADLMATHGFVPGTVAAVCFNLGYLPGGDKSLVTSPASTLPAMAAAASALRPGGLLTAICYTGHPGGAAEAEAAAAWAAALPQTAFAAARYGFLNQRNNPPHLIAVRRAAPVAPG
jgi:predicted methyltransferase